MANELAPPPLPTGESIEVLDIGLRKCREHRAVHRVKPAPSAHRLAAAPNYKHIHTRYVMGMDALQEMELLLESSGSLNVCFYMYYGN